MTKLRLSAAFLILLVCPVTDAAWATIEIHSASKSTDHDLRRLPPTEGNFTEWHSTGSSVTEAFLAGDESLSAVYANAKRIAWNGNGFKIVPYGAFWADMVYATERTNPGPFTFYVLSRDEGGEDALTIDARRSRFGLDVSGPVIPFLNWAECGGRAEIDFHADFTNENRPEVHLRHAYWEAKNDNCRLLVGQTWDVISPLIPNRLDYAVGLRGGNIGYRRTQFRAEQYWPISKLLLLSVQAALSQDVVTDFPADVGIRRESSNWPVVQGRAAMTWGMRSNCSQPFEIGISGHVGETGLDFLIPGPPPLSLPPEDDARFLTWSFNFDVFIPVTSRLRFQGELFTGANLSPFLGGIGQGVCPCLRVPIRSTGGWCEIGYDLTARLKVHAGYGLDDPNNNDSLLDRIYNQFIFANIVFDVTDRLSTGLEVTSWRTHYHETRTGLIPPDQLTPSAPGEALTIDWMIKYGF